MKKQLIILTIILLAIVAINQTQFVEVAGEAASIDAANSSINQAFLSVLEAEKAGGDITQLLIELNRAGELLAEAQNALQAGDLSGISLNAVSAKQIADQVNIEALNLKEVSLVESQYNLWATLVFSVVGAVVFGVALLLVWRRFKRAYMKRLLTLKPEVVEDAA